MDCDDSSSPIVSKANPVISPLPYQSNIVQSDSLGDEIGCDWAMEEEAVDVQAIENINAPQGLYSFYFEPCNVDQERDDLSITSHDSDFSEEGICLDNIPEDPASFWGDTVVPSTMQRRPSPAQISISSDSVMELNRCLTDDKTMLRGV